METRLSAFQIRSANSQWKLNFFSMETQLLYNVNSTFGTASLQGKLAMETRLLYNGNSTSYHCNSTFGDANLQGEIVMETQLLSNGNSTFFQWRLEFRSSQVYKANSQWKLDFFTMSTRLSALAVDK